MYHRFNRDSQKHNSNHKNNGIGMGQKRGHCGNKNNIKGCGGLVVSEHEGKIYLLMGKDYRGALCDFGGKRENGESCLQCATREFYEETSGTFLSQKEVKNLFCKCEETIFFNTYLCYVIRIKFDASIPRRYREYKRYVKKNGIKYPQGYFELNDMIWVEINDLYRIHFTKKLIHDRTRYILKKFFNRNKDRLIDMVEIERDCRSRISVSPYPATQPISIKTYTPVLKPSNSPVTVPTISL